MTSQEIENAVLSIVGEFLIEQKRAGEKSVPMNRISDISDGARRGILFMLRHQAILDTTNARDQD